jgi:hypothetical protein
MPVTALLMGGLGNQMFIVATGFGLAKKLGTSFYLVRDEFDGCGQGNHPNKYYDNIFASVEKRSSHIGEVTEHKEKTWSYYPLDSFAGDGKINLKLNGYFQSERHFAGLKSEIKNLFFPACGIEAFLHKNTQFAKEYHELFDTHDYCFIGVRRGDYVRAAHFHNPCGMTYYRAAMEACPASKYYIASDDLEWCRSQFVGPQFEFLDIEDDLHLMYLGCLFPKYIISNSTFHWWISYLSIYESPRIIAPDKWGFGAAAPRASYDSIYRDDMIVLERPVEA